MAVHPFWPSTLLASHGVVGWLLLPACGLLLLVTAANGLSIAVPLP